jgi:uncharacterized FlgJ-related protein
MINNKEDKSLLEVREWKEECRKDDENLSPKEYLEKLRKISAEVKEKYNIHLQKVSLAN